MAGGDSTEGAAPMSGFRRSVHGACCRRTMQTRLGADGSGGHRTKRKGLQMRMAIYGALISFLMGLTTPAVADEFRPQIRDMGVVLATKLQAANSHTATGTWISRICKAPLLSSAGSLLKN